MRESQVLVEVEGDFDRLPNGSRFTVRAESWTEAPGANRFHGFFVQAEAESLGDTNVGSAAIRGDNRDEQHSALVLCLDSFIGELRLRTIQAGRAAVSARACCRVSAAGAVLLARTEPIAISAANPVAASITE